MIKRYWRTISFVLGVFCIALIAIVINQRIDKNASAIYKSCILIDNAIRQSQQQTGGQSPTDILVKAILENSKDLGRPQVIEAYTRAAQNIEPLKALKCKALSQHPENIKAFQAPERPDPVKTPNEQGSTP